MISNKNEQIITRSKYAGKLSVPQSQEQSVVNANSGGNLHCKTNMAVFDVGPILEGVSSLQAKLEDATTKTRLLLEAIEGSQSKYKLTERNEDYPVLRSLKGRLAASQGPNESLSTELVKFKVELESFVEDIFQSHESFRTIRRNSLMHAKLSCGEEGLRARTRGIEFAASFS